MTSEIGRELLANELKQGAVVVIFPPGSYSAVTMWVEYVNKEEVMFYAGEIKWHVLNFVNPDGTIVDDRGKRVRVYEYLGVV